MIPTFKNKQDIKRALKLIEDGESLCEYCAKEYDDDCDCMDDINMFNLEEHLMAELLERGAE